MHGITPVSFCLIIIERGQLKVAINKSNKLLTYLTSWISLEEGIRLVRLWVLRHEKESKMTNVAATASGHSGAIGAAIVPDRYSRQAFYILQTAFVAAPVIAGLDKFTHLLVDWDKYLAPAVSNLVGGHTHQFMLVVGVIEVIAGIGVALMPAHFRICCDGVAVGDYPQSADSAGLL